MLIVGAGGLALQLLDDLEAVYGSNLTFWSDRKLSMNAITSNFSVLQTEQEVITYISSVNNEFILAVGGTKNREFLMKYFHGMGGVSKSFVAPSARISRFAQLGNGAVVCSSVNIEAGVTVGEGVLINLGSLITHDTEIGDFCEIAPGVVVGGGAKIGRSCFVGLNATILPKVTLGDFLTVGAGAVVTKSFPEQVTIKGIPART